MVFYHKIMTSQKRKVKEKPFVQDKRPAFETLALTAYEPRDTDVPDAEETGNLRLPYMARRIKRTKRKSRKTSRRKTRRVVLNAESIAKATNRPIDNGLGRGYHWNKGRGAWIAKGSDQSKELYGGIPSAATYDQLQQRQINKYRGLGDYSDLWNTYRKYVPRALGAAVGAYSGRSAQSTMAGWNAGGNFSKKYLGWGDYGSASTNQIMGGGNQLSVNADASNMSGDIYLSHREFIGNITVGSTGFENRTYPLNPGIKAVFPFLSQIAQNFTLYAFEGLIFEYVPLSGESSSASNSLGKVVLATDYDSEATGFRDINAMANYDYSNSAKPAVSIIHGVETDPSQRSVNMKYVRSGVVSRDKTFTDYGLFQCATQGVPDTGIVGELWVAYRIRLSRANIESSAGNDLWFDQFYTSCIPLSGNALITTQSTGEIVPDKYIVNPTVDPSAIANGAARVVKTSTLGGSFSQINSSTVRYRFPDDVRVNEVYTIQYSGYNFYPSDVITFSLSGCAIVADTASSGIRYYAAPGVAYDIIQPNAAYAGFTAVAVIRITLEPSGSNLPYFQFTHSDPSPLSTSINQSNLLVQFANQSIYMQ